MKKTLISFLIIIGLFFINISGVSAKTTCDYGVDCKYRLSLPTSKTSSSDYSLLEVTFQCENNKNKAGSCFNSYKTVAIILSTTNSNQFDDINISGAVLEPAPGDSGYFQKKGEGFFCPTLHYYKSNKSVTVDFKETNFQGGIGQNIQSTSVDATSKECLEEGQKVTKEQLKKGLHKAMGDSNYSGVDSSAGDESIIDKIMKVVGNDEQSTVYDDEFSNTCDLIHGDIKELLYEAFSYMSIAGIIILVVMTAISLVKVITASEDDALKNFLKGLWKRIVCLIILLLLPVLITFVINVVNGAGHIWGINDDPLCGITVK